MPKTKRKPEMASITLTSVFYCGPRVTAMTVSGKHPLLRVGYADEAPAGPSSMQAPAGLCNGTFEGF